MTSKKNMVCVWVQVSGDGAHAEDEGGTGVGRVQAEAAGRHLQVRAGAERAAGESSDQLMHRWREVTRMVFPLNS